MKLQKINKASLEIRNKILDEHNSDLQVGQLFVCNDCIGRVREIKIEQETEWVNGKSKKIKNSYYIEVYYDISEDLCKTWRNYDYKKLNEFLDKYSDYFIDNFEKYWSEVQSVIKGEKSINDYKDNQHISNETSLMHVKSKEYLKVLEKTLEQKRKCAELIAQGVRVEIERRKEELSKIVNNLSVIIKEFEEKVKQIQKVIATIELYLGIKEDIVQIQEGVSGGDTDTIHFWQNTLYMDEEVGDPMEDGQGLDFQKIEDFDKWILDYSKFYKKHNYELLIPQKKGLICLMVRREDKDYYKGDDSFGARWMNSQINLNNKKTYILIRNGSNIFRIWGDIQIHPKLFPDRSELNELQEKWEYLEDMENKENGKWIGESKYGYISNTEDVKKKINDQLFEYKKHMIMLQGLIDRTEIFYPISERIVLMSPEAQNKNHVKFVYEDDLRIGDGKLSFSEWQKSLNNNIIQGSRILFINNINSNNRKWSDYERFDKRYHNGSYWGGKTHYNLPNTPETGIYSVDNYTTIEERISIKGIANTIHDLPEYVFENTDRNFLETHLDYFPYSYQLKNENGSVYEYNKKVNHLAIYYNPGGEIKNTWDYWDDGHERKNSISYKIYSEDKNILNYDAIDLKDVEYYLYERRHRIEYLQMMPVLWKIKQIREEEISKEVEFVRGLVEDMKRNKKKIENPKQAIWDAVEWFKMKNKWKRPLTEHDELAWRMIKRKLGIL